MGADSFIWARAKRAREGSRSEAMSKRLLVIVVGSVLLSLSGTPSVLRSLFHSLLYQT